MIRALLGPYLIPALVGGVLVLMVGVYFKGRSDGVSAENLRNVAATNELNLKLKAANKQTLQAQADLLAAERVADALEVELNDEAAKDVNADRVSVGSGSVRRLNQTR